LWLKDQLAKNKDTQKTKLLSLVSYTEIQHTNIINQVIFNLKTIQNTFDFITDGVEK